MQKQRFKTGSSIHLKIKDSNATCGVPELSLSNTDDNDSEAGLKISFTLFRSDERIGKTFCFDDKGLLAPSQISRKVTDAVPVSLTVDQFFNLLKSFPKNCALGLGTIDFKDSMPVTTLKQYGKMRPQQKAKYITRSLNFFGYKQQSGFICIDEDYKYLSDEQVSRLSQLGGVRGVIIKRWPALADHMWIFKSSSSAGLFRESTGEPLTQTVGGHNFLVLQDVSDSKRVLVGIKNYFESIGLGGVIDTSVGSPERILFEEQAHLGEDIAQNPVHLWKYSGNALLVDSATIFADVDVQAVSCKPEKKKVKEPPVNGIDRAPRCTKNDDLLNRIRKIRDRDPESATQYSIRMLEFLNLVLDSRGGPIKGCRNDWFWRMANFLGNQAGKTYCRFLEEVKDLFDSKFSNCGWTWEEALNSISTVSALVAQREPYVMSAKKVLSELAITNAENEKFGSVLKTRKNKDSWNIGACGLPKINCLPEDFNQEVKRHQSIGGKYTAHKNKQKDLEVKIRALELRKQNFSLREIAGIVGYSKSAIGEWTKPQIRNALISLSQEAQHLPKQSVHPALDVNIIKRKKNLTGETVIDDGSKCELNPKGKGIFFEKFNEKICKKFEACDSIAEKAKFVIANNLTLTQIASSPFLDLDALDMNAIQAEVKILRFERSQKDFELDRLRTVDRLNSKIEKVTSIISMQPKMETAVAAG